MEACQKILNKIGVPGGYIKFFSYLQNPENNFKIYRIEKFSILLNPEYQNVFLKDIKSEEIKLQLINY